MTTDKETLTNFEADGGGDCFLLPPTHITSNSNISAIIATDDTTVTQEFTGCLMSVVPATISSRLCLPPAAIQKDN